MDRTYAAELDADGYVVRVIVGTAEWATENLGGTWVESDPCGPGWQWVDSEMVAPVMEQSEDVDGGAVTDEQVVS